MKPANKKDGSLSTLELLIAFATLVLLFALVLSAKNSLEASKITNVCTDRSTTQSQEKCLIQTPSTINS